MEDCWDDDEFRPLWDEGKALTGIGLMELAEVEQDDEERRSLARASARYFWAAIGVEVPSYGEAGARNERCAPCPVCRRDDRR